MIICRSCCVDVEALQALLIRTDIVSYEQGSLRAKLIDRVAQLCDCLLVLLRIQGRLNLLDQGVDLRIVKPGLIGAVDGHGVVNALGKCQNRGGCVVSNGCLVVSRCGHIQICGQVHGLQGGLDPKIFLQTALDHLALAEHRPFDPKKESTPRVSVVEKVKSRVMVADTDKGKELKGQIADLKELVVAYREGTIKERVE